MASEPTNGNGNVVKYRLDRVEHRIKGTEQAFKWLAEKGAKHNEQISLLQHDYDGLCRDVEHMKAEVAKVPVIERDSKQALEGWKSVRTALYTAGGGFVLLAASLLATGGPG